MTKVPLHQELEPEGINWRRTIPARFTQRTLLVLTILTCAFFAVRGWNRAMRPLGSDFTIYYQAAAKVLEGGNPLSVDRYLYPPVFAVLLAPMALLPYGLAAALWIFASWATLLLVSRAIAFMVAADTGVAAPILFWLPLALLLRFADSNLSNGQVNAFTLGMLVLSMGQMRRGRELAGGAWAGLATATKVLPGFILFYYLLRRRPKAALGGAVVTALLIFVAPIPVLGLAGNWEALRTWWETTVLPYQRGGAELLAARHYVPGQSLTAVCYRLLTPISATSDPSAGATANLMALDPQLVHWVVRVLGLLHLMVFTWVVTRTTRLAREKRMVEFGLALATALILGPLVHKAHMLWLLVAVGSLVAVLIAPGKREKSFGFKLLVVLGISSIALTTPGLLGRLLATKLLTYNTVFIGLELLWIAMVWDLWPPKRQSIQ